MIGYIVGVVVGAALVLAFRVRWWQRPVTEETMSITWMKDHIYRTGTGWDR